MIAWVLGLLGGKWRTYLAIAGISLVIVVGAYVKGYMAGRNSVEQAQLKETVRIVEKVKVVHEKVNRMPDGAALSELRRDWQR